MTYRIALLAGDGIGPEITSEAVKVLNVAAARHNFQLEFQAAQIGGAAFDSTGHPLPEQTLDACRQSDAVLLGAVGGPKWDKIEPPTLRPEVGALLPLRKKLGLFANLRPARLFEPLAAVSSLRADLVSDGLDLLVVRELTGGIYFGTPRGRNAEGRSATDTCTYTVAEIERIARVGFGAAITRSGRLCSVDKANVLETSRLWREVVSGMEPDYPQVSVTHMLVDNCAMQLVRDPRQFDVIVTENLFGDILSDEAAMLTGSLGMLPSASLGERREGSDLAFGVYEPVHGSAPSLAGLNVANPLATILSGAMLLRHSLGEQEAAADIETAVGRVLSDGLRTADIAASGATAVGTAAMGDAVVSALERQ